MCWVTKDKECAIKKIAEHDISVFKIVKYNDVTGTINSFFYDYLYEINRTCLLPEPLESYCIKFKQYWYRTDKGFYSYNKRCSYEVNYNNYLYINMMNDRTTTYLMSKKPAIMHCIIPTGAEYFENEYGEIVSNQIKPISIEEI